jgi:hypothetical protein
VNIARVKGKAIANFVAWVNACFPTSFSTHNLFISNIPKSSEAATSHQMRAKAFFSEALLQLLN